MPDDHDKRIRENEEALQQLRSQTDQHAAQLADGKAQIAANAKSISQLIAVVQGVMGRSGLIAESNNYADRLKELEDWKRDIKGFIAGVAFVGAIVGAIFSTLATWAFNHWLK